MGFSIACKDTGVDCNWTARGETREELMTAVATHGKEVHSYTDEQLNDPEMAEKIQSLVKED